MIEFKYEPDHSRDDIPRSKFPVVFWGADGVGKEVAKIVEFVEAGDCVLAWSVFIEEGRSILHRAPHPGSQWFDWDEGQSRLFSRAGST